MPSIPSPASHDGQVGRGVGCRLDPNSQDLWGGGWDPRACSSPCAQTRTHLFARKILAGNINKVCHAAGHGVCRHVYSPPEHECERECCRCQRPVRACAGSISRNSVGSCACTRACVHHRGRLGRWGSAPRRSIRRLETAAMLRARGAALGTGAHAFDTYVWEGTWRELDFQISEPCSSVCTVLVCCEWASSW